MMFPVSQFKERDLKEILTLKEVFQIASYDHDIAINRYSRLSKKRENEKIKDVYTSRKKQHQTMMHYFSALNTLQYKKIAVLEPLLGYMQAEINFFKMGSDNLKEPLEEFLTNIGTSVQNVRREMDTDLETINQTIEDLEVASDPLYLPDADPTKLPPNRNLTRKAGYLNTRNKTRPVSSSWERQYYFTQGGNLMSQARGDVAGGLVMDIDNSSAMAVDSEDQRYCFQITAFDGKNQGRPHAMRTNSSGSIGSDSSGLTTLSLDAIVAPDTPIQFDIISPVSEDQSGQAKTLGQSGKRTNPFGESGNAKPESEEDSILHQLFVVRFLGSMEVKAEENPDIVYETMHQILAARAIHNIFRMTESHLVVTCDCLKLIDPQTQVTRLRFPLPNVVMCATHQENKRLFGFVLRTAGSRAEGCPISVCYIFESNNEGEKICDSVGLAKQIAFHAELDLEKQCRLIAASSRTNQTTGEGQFVVLSNSQSEDSDLGEEGKKKRESEA